MSPIHSKKTAFVHSFGDTAASTGIAPSRYFRNLKRRAAMRRAIPEKAADPTTTMKGRPPERLETPRRLLHRWLPPSVHADADVLARLIRVHAETGCWLVRSADELFSYPTLLLTSGEMVAAHRWVYALLHGGIPEFYVVDHLCEVKSCVNPDHLEAVSVAENVKRSKARKKARGGA